MADNVSLRNNKNPSALAAETNLEAAVVQETSIPTDRGLKERRRVEESCVRSCLPSLSAISSVVVLGILISIRNGVGAKISGET